MSVGVVQSLGLPPVPARALARDTLSHSFTAHARGYPKGLGHPYGLGHSSCSPASSGGTPCSACIAAGLALRWRGGFGTVGFCSGVQQGCANLLQLWVADEICVRKKMIWHFFWPPTGPDSLRGRGGRGQTLFEGKCLFLNFLHHRHKVGGIARYAVSFSENTTENSIEIRKSALSSPTGIKPLGS